MAGERKLFLTEGTQTRKKKSRRGDLLKTGQGSHSSWKVNPNTGRMMNMLEDQDWALCDKDCGWCGHCAEGAAY